MKKIILHQAAPALVLGALVTAACDSSQKTEAPQAEATAQPAPAADPPPPAPAPSAKSAAAAEAERTITKENVDQAAADLERELTAELAAGG